MHSAKFGNLLLPGSGDWKLRHWYSGELRASASTRRVTWWGLPLLSLSLSHSLHWISRQANFIVKLPKGVQVWSLSDGSPAQFAPRVIDMDVRQTVWSASRIGRFIRGTSNPYNYPWDRGPYWYQIWRQKFLPLMADKPACPGLNMWLHRVRLSPSATEVREVWGFNGGDCEDYRFVGCNGVQFGRWRRLIGWTFRLLLLQRAWGSSCEG